MLPNICVISVAIFLTSYLSPQLQLYGRGLRVGLPAFCLAVACGLMSDPTMLFRCLHRLRWILLCGFIFLGQAAFRIQTLSNPFIGPLFVNGTLQVIMGVFLIFLVRELGGRKLRLLTILVFLGWTVSIALGVPTLLAKSGAARETMGIGLIKYVAVTQYMSAGVGSYTHYTATAVSFLAMAVWVLGIRRPWLWAFAALLAINALAVMISTFAMAAALLAVGLLTALGYWVFHKREFAMVRLIAAIIILVFVPGVVLVASESNESFSFVYNKVSSLWERTSETGLAQGDKTGRGAMFVEEMGDFLDSPVIGALGGWSEKTGHGHSSLSNTLLIHGLVGSIWWFAFLFLLGKSAWNEAQNPVVKAALLLSWLIFFGSGILNPTWHFTTIVLPLVLFSQALLYGESGWASHVAVPGHAVVGPTRADGWDPLWT